MRRDKTLKICANHYSRRGEGRGPARSAPITAVGGARAGTHKICTNHCRGRGEGRTGDPARTRGPGRVMWLDGQGPASQYHGPIDTLGPAPVPTLRGPPTTPRSAHPVASGLVLVLQPRLRCFPEVFPELASLRAWLVTGFPAWCAGGWVVAERGLECPGGTWAQRGSGLG